MTNDTIKSLGYLKKSLKMSKRATEKNQNADGITDTELQTIHTMIDILFLEIDKWEARALITSSIAQPTQPVPATIPFNPSTDLGDDILQDT